MKNLILIALLLISHFVSFAQTKLLVGRKDGTKDTLALSAIAEIKFSSPGIRTGTVVEISTTSIGTQGGTIAVAKPGTPIDGMVITIPPNSFPIAKTFTISYAEITGHTLGQYFNPISPMISVSYEGGYAADGLSVKIPIKLPVGHFAMGFFYDAATGTVEGMPIESLDDNFITVHTRSFGSAGSHLNKKSGISEAGSTGNMIVGSISESVLAGQTIITSGFTPGVDDWEFINYGSYVAPEGHCAGQSLTAMWYFYEKKLKGAPPLFHLLDDVNTGSDPDLLWQDNPCGYRFASTIQVDCQWEGWLEQMQFRSKLPSLSWKAFALSMLATGEPQSVLINNSHGLGGHAMIVYKINFATGKLYIADPNYPNNIDPGTKTVSIRTIDFVNAKFNSYYTGLTAGGPSIEMDQIGYFGKTAYLDWGKVGARWPEVENKTIGNSVFPAYSFKIFNDDDKDLTDQITTKIDTLKIYCKSHGCSGYITGTDRYQEVDVLDEQGSVITKSIYLGDNGFAIIPLKPGENKFGFYLMGATLEKFDNYLDFKWITINYIPPLFIVPNPLVGEPEIEHTLTARSDGKVPLSAKYVWTFGDNSTQTIVLNDSTVTHTFKEAGTFLVTVELYDNATNKKISEATADAIIKKIESIMIAVEGGTFQMGTDHDWDGSSPPHQVTVSSFHIDKYEMTYEKWTEVRNWAMTHGYLSTEIAAGRNGYNGNGAPQPVTGVTWFDILKWCNARSEMEKLTPVYYTNNTLAKVYRTGDLSLASDAVKWTANGYRLPTEAEWEYAAKGGKNSGSFAFSGSNTIGIVAWWDKNSGFATHPIGQKAANELGIYDMSGNAMECCWDGEANYTSTAQTDPRGSANESHRVTRGGHFGSVADYFCHSYFRLFTNMNARRYWLGFRCVQH